MGLILCLLPLALATGSPQEAQAPASRTSERAAAEPSPREPAQVLAWLAERWGSEGWTHPDPRRAYLRAPEDPGWKARMLALQQLVKGGEKSVEPLLAALEGDDENDDEELRIFAAQTLGYLAPHVAVEPLLAAFETDPSAAVRLYAADAIGMRGAAERLADRLAALSEVEPDKDVRKHIGYALERGASPVEERVIRELVEWDPATLNSAVVGKPAPDCTLTTYDGEQVRLSDFRGQAPVVLVFLYGDT